MNIFYYLYAFAFSSFLFVAAVGWVENPRAVLLNDIDNDEMEDTKAGTGPPLYDSLMDAFGDFNGYDHIAMMDEDDTQHWLRIPLAETLSSQMLSLVCCSDLGQIDNVMDNNIYSTMR